MTNDFEDIPHEDVNQHLSEALSGFEAFEVIQGKEARLSQTDIDLMKSADKLFIVCLRNQQGGRK